MKTMVLELVVTGLAVAAMASVANAQPNPRGYGGQTSNTQQWGYPQTQRGNSGMYPKPPQNGGYCPPSWPPSGHGPVWGQPGGNYPRPGGCGYPNGGCFPPNRGPVWGQGGSGYPQPVGWPGGSYGGGQGGSGGGWGGYGGGHGGHHGGRR